MLRKPASVFLVLLAAFVTLLPFNGSSGGFALAQDIPTPWVRLEVVNVNPEMVDEFVAVQRELSELAKASKVSWRTVSRTEVFGNKYRFFITSPMRTLGSLDQEQDASGRTSKHLALVNRMLRCVTSSETYGVHILHPFSNLLPEDQEADLMVVNVATVFPGREQEYINVMSADFLPHFNDAKVHHVTGSLAFGGASGYAHVYFIENFAELDQGSPVMQALGSDGAQAVNSKFAGIVSNSETWVSRVVREVSYGSLPEEKEEQ